MLLDIKDLRVQIDTARGVIAPVDRISFSIEEGGTLGLVGESGCGKSLTSLAIMGLLPDTATVSGTHMNFLGDDLLKAKEQRRREIRGRDIAMIFQDPMTSLNPSFTVGFQLYEVLKAHRGQNKKEREATAIRLLERVGIHQAKDRLHAYPHQLSGGMCQRVMIAMAIASHPRLLIADEPTTALDVTIQAQILDLLRELQEERKMALLLITHDLAVVSEMAERVAVMYAGHIVEQGRVKEIIGSPKHPYTEGLLNCLPGHRDDKKGILPTIPGLVPDLAHRPSGCQLNPRCAYSSEKCFDEEPLSALQSGREVKCHFPLELPA